MKWRVAAVLVVALFGVSTTVPVHAGDGPCAVRFADGCGGAKGSGLAGEFRGLIMVAGQPGVLELSSRSGTTPGCGDCSWTLILACLTNDPDHPEDQRTCTGSNQSASCAKGESRYRLYLTDRRVTNLLVDEICLGSPRDVTPVSDLAAADVDRYLRTVRPPALDIQVQPPGQTLVNLPTYFVTSPPPGLRPVPFGGGAVTEIITITPAHYTWGWGDGTPPLQTTDAGSPYPHGTLTHQYAAAGPMTVTLTTQWSATYDIQVAGQTFGPFDARGTPVPRTQTFTVQVAEAHSRLVTP